MSWTLFGQLEWAIFTVYVLVVTGIKQIRDHKTLVDKAREMAGLDV